MSFDFSTVTELSGSQAHSEQLSMIHTRYRLAYDLCAGKDVLEAACGPGRALGWLSTRARTIIGGDCTPALVDAANAHYQGRVKIVLLDAQAMPFPEKSFDLVLLFEALYYLPKPALFLDEARRVLRPGGMLLLCCPNPEWPGFNPSPYSVRYFSCDELKALLGLAGFEVEVKAGFPVSTRSVLARAVSVVRQTAVALNLVPKTMKGKVFLKRMFYGRLAPMGPEIDVSGPSAPLISLSSGPIADYKVLYAIARRRD